jgi:hypothetical protein
VTAEILAFPAEECCDVVAMPGLYQVSNWGRVHACERMTNHGHHRKAQLLRPRPNSNGYMTVTLHLDGHSRTVKVAVLVAQAFGGPRPSPRHWALHRNGNGRDDSASNLYWGTPAQNVADAKGHGTFNPYAGRKVTAEQVQPQPSAPGGGVAWGGPGG